MAALAELKAIVGIDAGNYKAGVKEITSLTSSFQKSISGIGGMLAGAFSVGAIIAFGKSLMNTAHEMDKTAEAVNLTMGALIALKTVAAEHGMDMEDLSKVLAKVRDAQGSLVNLSEKHEKALKSLNISANEFVGAGTDKALELIANAYVKANGSAEAFAAINDLFGGKIGRKTIEMLKALDAEGLGPLAERTKEATKGFEQLAAAQSKIEKFFNAIQLGAAGAITKIAAFGAELGRLSVEKPKMDWFTKYSGLGLYQNFWESIGAAFFGDGGGADTGKRKPTGGASANGGGSVNSDVTKMQQNQAAKDKIASDKVNEKAQELGRRYYFKELHSQDAIEKLQSDYAADITGLNKPGKIKGVGANVDNIAKIGGQIGMSRPGLAAEDRQIRILTEAKEIWKDMSAKLQQLIDQQDLARDRDEG